MKEKRRKRVEEKKGGGKGKEEIVGLISKQEDTKNPRF